MSRRRPRKRDSKDGSDERRGITRSKTTDRGSGTERTGGRVERLHRAAGNQAVGRAVEGGRREFGPGSRAGTSAGATAAAAGTAAGKSREGTRGPPGPEEAAEAMTYADLADDVYEDGGAPRGWERVENFENEDSGFFAALYRNASTDEVVLAFRGTNPLELADWTQANLPNALNEPSKQYRRAIELANRVAGKYENLKFTGHSLGGGLASAASMATGREAVTFNAAGPAPEQVLEIEETELVTADPEEDITTYVVQGDVVNWIQDTIGGQMEDHPLEEVTGGNWKVLASPSQGTRKQLPQPSVENPWDLPEWGSKLLGLRQHGMETVKEALAELQRSAE